jgi:hypothetical protein
MVDALEILPYDGGCSRNRTTRQPPTKSEGRAAMGENQVYVQFVLRSPCSYVFLHTQVYKVISDRGREAFSEEGRGRASYDAIKTTMMDALGIVPYGNLLM